MAVQGIWERDDQFQSGGDSGAAWSRPSSRAASRSGCSTARITLPWRGECFVSEEEKTVSPDEIIRGLRNCA